MTIRDLCCPDGKFATKLGRGVFTGGRHGNENGNMTVCGRRVWLWSVVGFSRSQLGVGGPAESPKPCASALWDGQRWTLAKWGCAG